MLWLLPIVAYVIGAIPFGVLISRAHGIDITRHGSGNVGATNVFRVVGKSWGILCLFLDFLKGFVPVLLAINLMRVEGVSPAIPLSFLSNFTEALPADRQLAVQTAQVLTALAAVLGHNYSIFLGLKGGKGIATSAGVLGALMPVVLLCMILIFALTFYLSGYVSLGSILAALSLPILRHLGDRLLHLDSDKSKPTLWESGTWNKPLLAFALVACFMAVWRHRSNIKRILAGTEDRLTRRTKSSPHES